MRVFAIGVGACFAVIALMIVGTQLIDIASLTASASGADESSPLRGVFRIPAYVVMLAAVLPLIFAVIGILGLRRF